MPEIVVGIFLILHGLVHFLYAGESIRLFELPSGMVRWMAFIGVRQLAYPNNLPVKAVPDGYSGYSPPQNRNFSTPTLHSPICTY